MKTYKGTGKDMKCRGFQYELGKTVTADGAVRCGDEGFHSCATPFDVLKYYGLNQGNRYFVAEADGKIDADDSDSKLASSELTLLEEIGVNRLISEQKEHVKRKAKQGTAGGDWSNLAGGDDSNLAGGDWSIVICRNGSKAKAGIGSIIVFGLWNLITKPSQLICAKTLIIDGETGKPDTWYTIKNGEIVEVEQ